MERYKKFKQGPTRGQKSNLRTYHTISKFFFKTDFDFQYLGSFPVTISNAKERARYIAQQLENILVSLKLDFLILVVK